MFGIKTYLLRHHSAVVNGLPIFAPGSAGDTKALARLTMGSARDTFPLIVQLMESVGCQPAVPIAAQDFGRGTSAEDLAIVLNHYGSDKVSHGYHQVYARILADREAKQVIEVGLGTNNEGVVSNMGREGRPGASLRAFRDYLPSARILGADIDRGILFTEDRIDTVWVDQTDVASFDELATKVDDFHLLIDDGLHSPDANLAVLLFGLSHMKVGAWTVIEDIVPKALPIWQVVHALLPHAFEATIIQANTSLMFAVQRLN